MYFGGHLVLFATIVILLLAFFFLLTDFGIRIFVVVVSTAKCHSFQSFGLVCGLFKVVALIGVVQLLIRVLKVVVFLGVHFGGEKTGLLLVKLFVEHAELLLFLRQ